MIDAGHGGYDNGAVYNGRTEKNDNYIYDFRFEDIVDAIAGAVSETI